MLATSAVSAGEAAALAVSLVLKASCRLAAHSIVVQCTVVCHPSHKSEITTKKAIAIAGHCVRYRAQMIHCTRVSPASRPAALRTCSSASRGSKATGSAPLLHQIGTGTQAFSVAFLIPTQRQSCFLLLVSFVSSTPHVDLHIPTRQLLPAHPAIHSTSPASPPRPTSTASSPPASPPLSAALDGRQSTTQPCVCVQLRLSGDCHIHVCDDTHPSPCRLLLHHHLPRRGAWLACRRRRRPLRQVAFPPDLPPTRTLYVICWPFRFSYRPVQTFTDYPGRSSR